MKKQPFTVGSLSPVVIILGFVVACAASQSLYADHLIRGLSLLAPGCLLLVIGFSGRGSRTHISVSVFRLHIAYERDEKQE